MRQRDEVYDAFTSLEDVIPPSRDGRCDACGERITPATRGPALGADRYCQACTETT